MQQATKAHSAILYQDQLNLILDHLEMQDITRLSSVDKAFNEELHPITRDKWSPIWQRDLNSLVANLHNGEVTYETEGFQQSVQVHGQSFCEVDLLVKVYHLAQTLGRKNKKMVPLQRLMKGYQKLCTLQYDSKKAEKLAAQIGVSKDEFRQACYSWLVFSYLLSPELASFDPKKKRLKMEDICEKLAAICLLPLWLPMVLVEYCFTPYYEDASF